MTDTTTPTVVTEWNVTELEDEVNARFAAGEKLFVAGREVGSWGKPAKSWGTGSLSVDVKTSKGSRSRFTQVWFKKGQTLVLRTEA